MKRVVIAGYDTLLKVGTEAKRIQLEEARLAAARGGGDLQKRYERILDWMRKNRGTVLDEAALDDCARFVEGRA